MKKAEAVAENTKKSKGLSADERAAMKEHLKELKMSAKKEDWEKELMAKIAELPEEEQHMAMRIHELVKANAPELSPKTWYGMPAYADKDENIICFFQSATKFKARYATFGFNDHALLDDGDFWPVAFALKAMDADIEKKITALIKKAVR